MRSLLLIPVGIVLRIYLSVAFVMVYFDKRKKAHAAQLEHKKAPATA